MAAVSTGGKRGPRPRPRTLALPEQVAADLDLLARRWVPHLLYLLAQGPARYSDLAAALPGLSARVLSDRLRELGEQQLLEQVTDASRRNTARYQLTNEGRRLATRFSLDRVPSGSGLAGIAAQFGAMPKDLTSAVVFQDGVVHGVAAESALPPLPDPFIGRGEIIRLMDGAVTATYMTKLAGPHRFALTGPAGVGKTALLTYWARTRTRRFPDGRLYVSMAQHHVSPGDSTAAVLTEYLRQLGVPSTSVPDGVDGAVAAFQQAAEGRRLLLILDDVTSAERVRPLLSALPQTVTVALASREPLAELGGALFSTLPVDPLSQTDAVELLAALVGVEIVAEQLPIAILLTRMCRYLPAHILAVAQAVNTGTATLAEVANRNFEAFVGGVIDHLS